MSNAPLMPMATAVWLVENTTLTFKQIADFCKLHEVEIQGIADGEVAKGIKAYNPIISGQLSREEIELSSNDENRPLQIKSSDIEISNNEKKIKKYIPLSKRQDKPDSALWLLKNHNVLKDSQIAKLVGITKNSVSSIRNKSYWNYNNLNAKDPVAMSLFTQKDLMEALEKAERRAKREKKEKEALSKEMEVLGLYVSGHPLLEHADDLEEFTTVSFEEGQEISKKDTVLVGGMITKIVRRYDKRNREMAFFDLDCLGGHAEIVVFSDCYKSYGNLIDDGKVVFVRGKPSETSDFSDLKILSDEIISVENVRDRLSQCLNIKFAIGKVETSDIDDLMTISKSNPGGCKLLFHLPNPDSPKPLKVLAHNVSVSTNITFIKQLRDKYGKDNVWID